MLIQMGKKTKKYLARINNQGIYSIPGVGICVIMYMYMPKAGVHKFKMLRRRGDKFLYGAA
jgi:hypothetical protein